MLISLSTFSKKGLELYALKSKVLDLSNVKWTHICKIKCVCCDLKRLA